MGSEDMAGADVSWLRGLINEPNRNAAAAALGATFLDATPEARDIVINGWDFGVEWPYPAPERLACVNGEDASPRQRIVSTLVLDSLEGVFGSREHLVALSATYRSCELAGLSPVDVFEAVAKALPAKHAEMLRNFLHRRPEDRALGVFGLTERVNADGEVEVVAHGAP